MPSLILPENSRGLNAFAIRSRPHPRFLVNDIRHPRYVAGIIFFQNIHQTLTAASSHAFFRIGREPRDAH
jgi:hypothetical protein